MSTSYSSYRCAKTGNSVQRVQGQARTVTSPPRDLAAQKTVSKGSGDHAGHLLAASLGGSPGRENLSRQNAAQNTGAYKKKEEILKRALKQGSKVHIDIKSVTRPGQERPLYRKFDSRETRPDGQVIQRSVLFGNFHTPASRKALEQRAPRPRAR